MSKGKIVLIVIGVIILAGIGFVYFFNRGMGEIKKITINPVDLYRLEDGTYTTTDDRGRYYLRKVATGDHTITLDINSVPIDLLPQISLRKNITLFEGMSFRYNVPLKRTRD